ncbi:serine/threonine-protein kinase [Actinoplanes friuliensis]|uniref:non-specific serine/threonine protein kinase n=1 Tax=Actinoplanes friuliensis DSM 7358 TaxID=1246995 RepID=U5VT11_9ACTN|nr:serine/threonine-protein kinase [Actinoplanes friuliensis]AGZ40004.1 putative serine/threonine protein kinase [Actinoplanes friuliensis DSM 7358]
MLSSGSLLDNRYRLDERIATGGMGDVWRGTDVVLGRTIAVKVLRTAMLSDPEFAARFYGEARMMAAFRHPGVVEVYDYSAGDANDEDNCAYLVMAFVDGEPLSARLKDQGRLGVAETMSIVAQAADALHAAHENGTVHRDVKPGNLIVKPNGTVILVDFGVARSAAVTSVTGLNAIVGTALYMAPEQVAKGNVTPATDVYALGAVAYHCIAGHPPFDGDNALQVALRHLEDDPEPLPANTVPPAVHELISRAMAKNPDDRFANAAEFAEAALAASGALDWRSQTGTSMTGTALRRPTMTGTTLGASTLGGAATSGTSLSGTSLTRPMSPAGPNRVLPGQRNLLEAAPAARPLPARKGRTRNELVVLFTVIGLFVLAGGLALAIAMRGNEADAGQNNEPGVAPAASSAAPEESDEPVEPTETPTRTSRPNQPNGTAPSKSASASPSKSASASASASKSPTPTATTTTPPATEPTTTPTEDPPTTEPTDPGEEGGGNGGTGAGN